MEALERLNCSGLFPAPGQADDVFWNKVDHVLSQANFSEPFPDLLARFDVKPYWVSVETGNQGLQFWEGAVLWQEQMDAGFVVPKIQLSDRVQRFYTRDELMSHEMVHAVRSDFAEEQFEEVLAYATSPRAWRRWLGPFFRNPTEASVFLWTALFTMVMQCVEVATEWTAGWLLFPWIPICFISIGAARLQRTHRFFRRCLRNLAKVLSDPEKKWAVIVRMSDAEIRACSQMKPNEIQEFVAQQKEKSLRWKMLSLCYFEGLLRS